MSPDISLVLAIGKLKRATIDAYMNSQGFELSKTGYVKNYIFGIIDGHPSNQLLTYRVTLPSALGEGGGILKKMIADGDRHVLETDSRTFSSQFDELRDVIESKLGWFVDMPNPSRLVPMINLSETTLDKLGYAVDVSNHLNGQSVSAATTPIILQVATCTDYFSQMDGGFVHTFVSNFLNRLPGVIIQIRALAYVWWTALNQEKNLWSIAPGLVEEFIAGATETMVECSQRTRAPFRVDWDLAIRVTGYVVLAAVVVASDGTLAPVLATTSLGLTLLTDARDETNNGVQDDSELSFDDLLQKFQMEALHLHNTIQYAERKLRENLIANMLWSQEHLLWFEIQPDPDFVPMHNATISRESGPMELFRQSMDEIVIKLKAAAQASSGVQPESALVRSGNIGFIPSGPGPEFGEMTDFIHNRLQGVVDDISSARGQAEEWWQGLHDHEEGSIAAIAALMEAMEVLIRR